jgi:penicillin-binding protein 1A
MGTYTPVSDVISVKNQQGQTLYQWKDQSKQVIDPQTAYIINDMLHDRNARAPLWGNGAQVGAVIPGVATATKTGTSDTGGYAKDIWMASWSPVTTMTVWYGNHIPKPLISGNSQASGPLVSAITQQVYSDILIPEGKYSANQWFDRPAGVQTINGDIYPSWYNKSNSNTTKNQMTFDQVSKKLATDCTPEAAKVTKEVTVVTDPSSGAISYSGTDGWDPKNNDDVHDCNDSKPFVGPISATPDAGKSGSYVFTTTISPGTSKNITSVSFTVNGQTYNASQKSGMWTTGSVRVSGSRAEVTVTATDELFYDSSASQTITVSGGGNSSGNNSGGSGNGKH